MTRRTLNADGTITLKSFSYWGNGDAAEAFRGRLRKRKIKHAKPVATVVAA